MIILLMNNKDTLLERDYNLVYYSISHLVNDPYEKTMDVYIVEVLLVFPLDQYQALNLQVPRKKPTRQ